MNNQKLLFSILSLIFSMVLLTFASFPIYNLFCKVTGYGGTVQRDSAGALLNAVGTKEIIVEFDSNVRQDLPWSFRPKQKNITIKPGMNALVFYYVESKSNHDIIGTAVFNVSPSKAAKYFNKIYCFCFEEQIVKAKQKMILPVSFFISKDIENDRDMDDVKTITLSYSFFKIRDEW